MSLSVEDHKVANMHLYDEGDGDESSDESYDDDFSISMSHNINEME